MITSPHNPKLKEIRKLAARRERDADGAFVAEGEDLVAAATRPAGGRSSAARAAGSGLDGDEVEPELARGRLRAGLGDAGDRRLRAALGRAGGPAAASYLHGRRATPATSARSLRAALAFGAACVVLGPGCADPYGPKAVRASDGRDLRGAARARRRRSPTLPGETVALVVREGERAARAASDATITLLVGAERDGLPRRRSSRRATRVGAHPDRARVAERRDGGDRRAVRVL